MLVSNGDDLRVEDHLVHLLHIVHFVVHFLLGLREEGLVLRGIVFLLFGWLHFLRSLLVHGDHLCFLSFRFGESSCLLLVSQSLFLKNLVFCFDSRCVLDSIEVVLAEDNCVILVVLFGLSPDVSQLIHSNESCRCLNSRWELVCLRAS